MSSAIVKKGLHGEEEDDREYGKTKARGNGNGNAHGDLAPSDDGVCFATIRDGIYSQCVGVVNPGVFGGGEGKGFKEEGAGTI